METIINYLADYFIPKLIKLQMEYCKNPSSLADLAIATREETDKLGREFIKDMIQEIDTLIKELPARKKKWVVEHKADSRKILTTLGSITYNRVLYTSKTELNENGKALECYLLDKLLDVAPNQEMTEDVMANVYKEAVQTSYRKAGEEASNQEKVSKETVKNLLHKTRFPKNYQVPEKKKEVEYLYIDADEDHYHLQFIEKRGDIPVSENGRKLNGGICKMAYVFEDIQLEAPKSKRYKLTGTHYFCRGDDQSNKEFWQEIFAYIEANYDVEKIKKYI